MRIRSANHRFSADSSSPFRSGATRHGAARPSLLGAIAALVLLAILVLPEAGVAGVGRMVSQWMTRAPAIDGVIAAGEWDEAVLLDLGSGVTIRLGNDSRTLYVAVLDSGSLTIGGGDFIALHFDDEGGGAPVLDDNVWGNSSCQQIPNLGEGNLLFAADQSVSFQEISGPQNCLPIAIVQRLSFRTTLPPEGMTFEVAIPLDGPAPLRAGPGQRFGVRVQVYRDGSNVACLPACAGPDPANFRNLVLASGGCNTGPQTFGSGDPRVGLPLDWTADFDSGSGQSWQQTQPAFFGDPVFCDANDTGGTGAAACVANVFYTTLHATSRLRMPLALAGQSTVNVRARAVLTVDPNGGGAQEYLIVVLRRLDESGSFLFQWVGQDQSGTINMTLPLSGSPPAELWFIHNTNSGGGVEGGYVQIDDVELNCGPTLFQDGFESGLSTHWSATVP